MKNRMSEVYEVINDEGLIQKVVGLPICLEENRFLAWGVAMYLDTKPETGEVTAVEVAVFASPDLNKNATVAAALTECLRHSLPHIREVVENWDSK